MSAFGDKCELCGRNDFLPIRCDLCGVLLCTEHRPLSAHSCKGQVDMTQSDRPPEVGLGAALAAGMDEVSRRFEGKEWSTKEHYKIKGSAGEPVALENQFMRAYRDRLQAGDMSEKQRRMTNQVRKMLLKSKATGRSDLHPDDRFYLEVRFGGGGGGGGESGRASKTAPEEEGVDYIYISRLRTAGRVLDEVIAKHQQAVTTAYEGWSGVYGLASERSGDWVPLGTALSEMDPEVLQSCDVVTVLPYTPQAVTAAAGAVVVEPSPPPPAMTTVAQEDEVMVEKSEKEASALPAGDGDHSSGAASGGGIVLTVQEGKTGHVIRFSDEEWPTATVADLKARVEAVTGMRHYKQKLLFKGILADDQVLSQTKLKSGSKITLMTAQK